ncbi:MAG: hypothetical protein IJ001_00055 [Oscillospiraceae bacterium]|nr:hypothetical protein [Oscillospiraceae bacterium]
MKKKGTIIVAAGAVLFVIGMVTLANSSVGILLMLLGIAAMIIGSFCMMKVSGKMRTNYFENAFTYPSEQASLKSDIPSENLDRKQD